MAPLKRAGPLLKELWLPLVVAALFITVWFYQQELIVKLGIATAAQFRAIFPYALGIGVWMSLAYLINRLLAIVFWEPLNRRVPVPRLLRDVTALLIYGMAVTGIVGVVFGKPIEPFWAASGAGAIVIGLALRNVILDIFIGLAVNFDRAFEIGDFIMLAGGPSGRVVEFNWRTTRLLTSEGNIVLIPNGKFGEMIVTNLSKPEPTGEFELSVFLDYDVPAERALRVLTGAVHSVVGRVGILDSPAPSARIRGISVQGVEYKIKYYQDPRKAGPGGTADDALKAPNRAQHEVWKAVLDQLNHAGFQPATPKQDVFHAARPQRQLDTHSLEDRVALLARVELFESLNVEERTQLSRQMHERLFKEGEAVIQLGDHGDSMFIVCEGLLEVRIALREGQAESRVARLQPGMFFGEMSALTGEPRSALVVAVTDALVFEISKDHLAALIHSRHELAEMIAQAVTTRKLRNSEAVARAAKPGQTTEKTSMTALLLNRMRSFFGLKPRLGKPASQPGKNASGPDVFLEIPS
jgi:small-conductance mechanosensitive channel/CRP-like cAMP-binding protein